MVHSNEYSQSLSSRLIKRAGKTRDSQQQLLPSKLTIPRSRPHPSQEKKYRTLIRWVPNRLAHLKSDYCSGIELKARATDNLVMSKTRKSMTKALSHNYSVAPGTKCVSSPAFGHTES